MGSSQQILNSDKRIEDLAIHEHLRTRPHVIAQSIFAQPPQPETTQQPETTTATNEQTTEPAQAQGEAAHWQPKVKPQQQQNVVVAQAPMQQQQQKVVCSEGVAAPPPPQQLVNNENAEDLAN